MEPEAESVTEFPSQIGPLPLTERLFWLLRVKDTGKVSMQPVTKSSTMAVNEYVPGVPDGKLTVMKLESNGALEIRLKSGEVDHVMEEPADAPLTTKVFCGLGSLAQTVCTAGLTVGGTGTSRKIHTGSDEHPAASVAVTQ